MRNITFFNNKLTSKKINFNTIQNCYVTELTFYKLYPTINHMFTVFKYLRFFKKTSFFCKQFNLNLINNYRLLANFKQKFFFFFNYNPVFFINFFFGWATTFKLYFFFKNINFFNNELKTYYDIDSNQEIINYLLKDSYSIFISSASLYLYNFTHIFFHKSYFKKFNQTFFYKLFFFFLFLNNSVRFKKNI